VSDIAHEEVLNDSCQAQSLLFGIGRSLFVKLRVNSYFRNCNDINSFAKLRYFTESAMIWPGIMYLLWVFEHFSGNVFA
jgi:hypothetical protein